MIPADSVLKAFSSFGFGMLFSGLHFGGLWMTLRVLPYCRRPRLFFWASYLGRIAVTLWGFALVMEYGGPAWMVSFVGFYLMRAYLLSRVSGAGMCDFLTMKRMTWK
ncbi:ATP synthase subunit I [Maridesulfovibrio sp. FT414]|uniref:ATP synthase subunit I n=1 Tax=Maridesulfovibrio sp. FT414 TaxID=2979469 RepID=UPI003D8086CF